MENKELIKILLEQNEWQTFDCKGARIKPGKLMETVVAFANTDGGTIALGLEDPEKTGIQNRLLGISDNLDNVSDILKYLERDISPPIIHWSKQEIYIQNVKGESDKLMLIFIDKSNDIHSHHGDTYVRHGRQNSKIGAQEIKRLQYEKGVRSFEDEISGITSLEELDLILLEQYRQDVNSGTADYWQILKDNGLAKNQELTKAAVLLFGNNPSVTLKSKFGIKISHYFGTKPNFSGEPNFVEKPFTIEGSLIKQIEGAVQYFSQTVRKAPPKLKGSVFRSSMVIPQWAFQEAVTNAVIHRNYSIQNDIHIRLFDDRIEIESPGTYPGHVTVRSIRSERFARNPLIQRTLNRFVNSPNLDIGEGVDRMFQIMQESNLYEPLFLPPDLRPNSVLLVLFNLQKIGYWDTVSKYLNEQATITSKEARTITSIKDSVQMSRMFAEWVEKGLLEKHGASKRSTYYKKPGTISTKNLFSSGLKDN